jgi:hypothetical protein
MNQSFSCLTLATNDAISSMFSGIDGGQRFVLIVVAIGCLTGLLITTVSLIVGLVQTIHRRRVEVDLKRELLDRGLGAEEIARIVESGQPQDFLERWASRKPPSATP